MAVVTFLSYTSSLFTKEYDNYKAKVNSLYLTNYGQSCKFYQELCVPNEASLKSTTGSERTIGWNYQNSWFIILCRQSSHTHTTFVRTRITYRSHCTWVWLVVSVLDDNLPMWSRCLEQLKTSTHLSTLVCDVPICTVCGKKEEDYSYDYQLPRVIHRWNTMSSKLYVTLQKYTFYYTLIILHSHTGSLHDIIIRR